MADILIRGMEMPKERSLWLCVKTDGTVYNIKPGGIGTAHAVGTAVPLPAGHGRLIDAGKLIKEMFTASDGTIMGNTSIDGWPFEMKYADIKRYIRKAPTIVPAEGGTDECSEN